MKHLSSTFVGFCLYLICAFANAQTVPTTISISISKADALCFGQSNGYAVATAYNGTAPYTYKWSNNVTETGVFSGVFNLAAGTYSVTATDANNNTATASVVIGQPNSLTITGVGTTTKCFGGADGSLSLVASGGVPPFSYTLSGDLPASQVSGNPTFSGLQAGIYYGKVVDANSCNLVSTAIQVNQPPMILISLAKTNISTVNGSDGTITVTASGGTLNVSTPAYQYSTDGVNFQTSNIFTGLSAGDYRIRVKDANECIRTDIISINQPPKVFLSAIPTSPTCQQSNGAINLTVSGGTAPFTYLWSNGSTAKDLSNLAQGTYTVTVTDAANATATTSVSLSWTGCRFDLALKMVPKNPAQQIKIGDDVIFVISVYNQGTIAATNIQITDYVPAGMTLNHPAWTAVGATATLSTPIPFLAIGVFTQIEITLKVNTGTFGIPIINNAEISNATNSLNLPDFDSRPDSTPFNDAGGRAESPTDDYINGNGTGVPGDLNAATDEDDADPAAIRIMNPNLGVLISSTNVLCFGNNTGAATANPSSGVSPYTYLWSTGSTTQSINNLVAGTYIVTVTDANSATATASVIINQPTKIAIASVVTNVRCFGGNDGSMSVITSGGVPPYVFTSNTGVNATPVNGVQTYNALQAGTYFAQVRDFNGCSASSLPTTVSQPLVLNFSTAITNVSTNGGNDGSVSITASGGNSPYQYSKDGVNFQTENLFSGLSVGTFTITVKDANACLKSTQVVISQPVPLTLTITKTDAICNGGNTGTATLNVSGGNSPYTYLWSTGSSASNISNLTSGIYTATVIDNTGSTASATISISEPSAGSISTTNTNPTCSTLGSIAVSAIGGSGVYLYSINSQAYQANNSFSNLNAGIYTIMVTDNNSCFIGEKTANIQPYLPIDMAISSKDVICGEKGSITINATGGNGGYSYQLNTNGFQANNVFSALAAGNYTITVKDLSSCTATSTINISSINNIGLSAKIGDCIGSSGGQIIATTLIASNMAFKLNNGAYQIWREFNNLPMENYTVFAKDTSTGCVDSVKVFMPEGLKIALNKQNILCKGANNGKITITATGGKTTNYQYKLNNGAFQSSNVFNNLLVGNYTITVLEGLNCISTVSTTITEPTKALSVTATTKNISCGGGNDGTITLTIAGGTTTYGVKQLLKSNQIVQTLTANQGLVFQNVAAGVYVIKVFDANNCEASTNVTLTQPTALVLNTSSTNVTCFEKNNGVISAEIKNGVSPFIFNLTGPKTQTKYCSLTSNYFDDLPQGSYLLTVSDKRGCSISKTIIISQPAKLNLTLTATPVSKKTASDGKITAVATGGTLPYLFQLNSGAFQSSNVFSNLKTNIYYVTVKDKEGCKIQASITVPIATTSLANDFTLNSVSNLVMSPNPIESNNLRIKIDAQEDDNVIVELVDSKGKLAIKKELNISSLDSEIILDISSLERTDNYIVNVYSDKKAYGKGRLMRLR